MRDVRMAKARKKVSKSRPGSRLKPETYQAITAAYIKHRTIQGAAKEAGVAERTVRKYVEFGDPKHNMPAIKDRLQVIEETAQRIENMTLAKFRAEQMEPIIEALRTSRLELSLHRASAVERAKANREGAAAQPAVKFNEQVTAHDRLVRLGQDMLGAGDVQKHEMHHTHDPIGELTPKQVQAYLLTGIMPAHPGIDDDEEDGD